MEVTLPAGLATLEKALTLNKGKSGYFVGKKVRLKDMTVLRHGFFYFERIYLDLEFSLL